MEIIVELKDILSCIFYESDLESIFIFPQVCKKWKIIFDDNFIWKSYCLRKFPSLKEIKDDSIWKRWLLLKSIYKDDPKDFNEARNKNISDFNEWISNENNEKYSIDPNLYFLMRYFVNDRLIVYKEDKIEDSGASESYETYFYFLSKYGEIFQFKITEENGTWVETIIYLNYFTLFILNKKIDYNLLSRKTNFQELFDLLNIEIQSNMMNLKLLWYLFGKIDVARPRDIYEFPFID